jgi:hypothetical protein
MARTILQKSPALPVFPSVLPPEWSVEKEDKDCY